MSPFSLQISTLGSPTLGCRQRDKSRTSSSKPPRAGASKTFRRGQRTDGPEEGERERPYLDSGLRALTQGGIVDSTSLKRGRRAWAHKDLAMHGYLDISVWRIAGVTVVTCGGFLRNPLLHSKAPLAPAPNCRDGAKLSVAWRKALRL